MCIGKWMLSSSPRVCVSGACVCVCVPDIFTGRMEAYNGYYFIAYI